MTIVVGFGFHGRDVADRLQQTVMVEPGHLLDTRSTVASIALEVGYDSEAAFARAFKRSVGKPPATWRRERDGRDGQTV